ncbi:MAG TPA: ligase-associated DNA damage response DEXH box helicase [Casimicrobiaceae bacterium]|nr:ligase-associated DNA damage response DEXH box helicase [Casimicrobiaceae bacterium]
MNAPHVPALLAPGAFAAARDWFRAQGYTPFAFQEAVWQAYAEGRSGLIHAPTGMGKTYAALLGPLVLGPPGVAERAPALSVLWITPLRALAQDTGLALQRAASALQPNWSVDVRTGDTSASSRARQAQRLPTILVTTPESLTLLLSRDDWRERVAELRAVVVDEWHELLSSKRGVQVELALARLRTHRAPLRTWGLSATLANLDEALACLVGPRDVAGARVVEGLAPKTVEIATARPATIVRFPWGGHIGLALLPQVVRAIEHARSTLVFTNVRSATEIWYQALLEARPDWAGQIALHHGSLEREVRDFVEEGLRTNRLRAVVCTSSLDLGVDFAPVDQVLQIGSPKGVARLLQRAGRSGHRPGAVSKVTVVPTQALELVEAAAAREAAHERRIEPRKPLVAPLDVLVQHLVTCALGGGYRPADLLTELRTTNAYAALRDDEWQWALDFVVYGGASLNAYPEYRRVVIGDDGVARVPDAQIARRHRMQIGTIVSDASIVVQLRNGRRLGHVEESFIARLAPGDCFVFAGRVLEFLRVREMTAWVRLAPSQSAVVTRWLGTKMPLSTLLSERTRRLIAAAKHGRFDSPELALVRPLLELQARWSALPDENEWLCERIALRDGHYAFFYPFEGRLAHLGLATLVSYRLTRDAARSFSLMVNDYGFGVMSKTPFELSLRDIGRLLAAPNLEADILSGLNAAELGRRQFREIARVAGLVFQGYPGQPQSNRQLQASSGLLWDVFNEYDPDNLLLRQASREVLERQLEAPRLAAALARMRGCRAVVTRPSRPTPFAFPLLVELFREKLTTEALEARVARMVADLEAAAGPGGGLER